MSSVNSIRSAVDYLTGASKSAQIDSGIHGLLKLIHTCEEKFSDERKISKLLKDDDLVQALKDRNPPILCEAAANGKKNVLRALQPKMPSEIHRPDADGMTPLMHALKAGHEATAGMVMAEHVYVIKVAEEAEQARQAEESLTRADNEGNTALIWAALAGFQNIVEILLDVLSFGGAGTPQNLNAQNRDGHNALMFASTRGYVEIVNALIESKVDLNAVDKFGRTALYYAIESGDREVFDRLIEAGASLRTLDSARYTELLTHPNVDKEMRKILLNLYENEKNNNQFLKLIKPSSQSLNSDIESSFFLCSPLYRDPYDIYC